MFHIHKYIYTLYGIMFYLLIYIQHYFHSYYYLRHSINRLNFNLLFYFMFLLYTHAHTYTQDDSVELNEFILYYLIPYIERVRTRCAFHFKFKPLICCEQTVDGTGDLFTLFYGFALKSAHSTVSW